MITKMLSMRLLSRTNPPQYGTTIRRLHTSTLLYDSSDSSFSDSDKDTKRKPKAAKPGQSEEQKIASQRQTTERLNSLLETMMRKSEVSETISQKRKVPKTLDLSIPVRKPKPKPESKKKSYEESLISAAQTVATTLGGDVRKTESDLLKKLLSTEKSRSAKVQHDAPSTPLSLRELLAGMNVEQTPRPSIGSTPPKSVQARSAAKQFGYVKSQFDGSNVAARIPNGEFAEPAGLYGRSKLKIFTNLAKESPDIPKLKTWETLEKREIKLAMSHPPENIFQEMILWTEQGKLWKFPIDNEQGMEEEQSVHFSEHVFMERHLKDWCPRRGPIRHFMELVCVGLSKNPYMTVKEKKDHVAWYREYFGGKQELLKELGVVEEEVQPQSKQIEA